MLSTILCLVCNTWLTIHGPSYHTSLGYNNQTYGLGISVDIKDKYSLSTGVFENSYGNTSAYITGGVFSPKNGNWRVGGVLGLASGYKEEKGTPVIGFGVLEYSVYKDAKILFLGLPPVGDLSGVISVLLQVRIK